MADLDPTTGRAPAFQFYPKDFLTDENVRVMSLQERGAYITLICLCWSEGTLPADVTRLARLCGVPAAAFRRLWPSLEPCFRADSETPGRLIHPRLERERTKQADFKRRQSDAGKRGADKRWQAHSDPMAEQIGSPLNRNGDEQAPAMANDSSSSAISNLHSSSTSSDSSQLPRRAGAFCEWYADQHYKLFDVGYIGNPQKDYRIAQELCQKASDAELRDAALVWFGMDDDFATKGTRTLAKFASRATHCIQIARKVSA